MKIALKFNDPGCLKGWLSDDAVTCAKKSLGDRILRTVWQKMCPYFPPFFLLLLFPLAKRLPLSRKDEAEKRRKDEVKIWEKSNQLRLTGTVGRLSPQLLRLVLLDLFEGQKVHRQTLLKLSLFGQ